MLALPGRAHGDSAVDPQQFAARPWANGVSDSELAIAMDLHVSGNREFADSHFEQALAKYRDAIQHWDHPAIRYNMAICLLKLDRIVEARDHLERSLSYGAAALGAGPYQQALLYRKLLDAQLAHVTITVQEPAAGVTLDGSWLFTGPGSREIYLQPGKHEVTATKARFLPATMAILVTGGEQLTYELEPAPSAPARPRPSWRPWAVFAGGAAAIGLGAVSYTAGQRGFADYDRAVVVHCPRGCDRAALAAAPEILRTKNRARTEQMVGVSLFAVGGAALVAGAISLFLEASTAEPEPRRAGPVVVPTRGGGTAAMSWRF